MTETKGGLGLRGVIEVRAHMATAHRAPPASAGVKAAGSAIRQVGVSETVQARTVFAQRATPVAIEHRVLIKDVQRGEVKIEAHKVQAFFEKTANPVFRLVSDGMITGAGGLAACVFAEAGDRVLGAARVRTVNLDGLPNIRGGAEETVDKDRRARERWDAAREALRPEEFRVMDGVMRHDESLTAAASAVRPKVNPKNRHRLQGIGDEILISACVTLADVFGFQTRADAARELAGE